MNTTINLPKHPGLFRIMATYEGMSFVVGETFASYAELEAKKRNKRTNVVQLVHRESRTLEAARK